MERPARADPANQRIGLRAWQSPSSTHQPIYVGTIRHKDAVYDGEHPAIVDQDTFDRVQSTMAQQGPQRRSATNHRDIHLLYGLLRDEAGHALSSTHETNHGKRYRYYVSRSGDEHARSIWRSSSTMIEPTANTHAARLVGTSRISFALACSLMACRRHEANHSGQANQSHKTCSQRFKTFGCWER